MQRIGLSATQKPIETVARFSPATSAASDLDVIDKGYQRDRELVIEVPDSPLEAVIGGRCRQQVHNRLARLVEAHRTTLDFVDTRRLAQAGDPSAFRAIAARQVMAHHGSLSKEQRLTAEHS